MATLEVPLANPVGSPQQVSADFYYRIPVRPIYKSYPVYAPGHEPPGYMDWLKQQEPVIIWDEKGHAPQLNNQSDWVNAGELVFDAPIAFNEDAVTALGDVRDPEWYRRVQPPLDANGKMRFYSFVIQKKVRIDLGQFACAECHTRVLANSAIIKGAQGNFPLDRARAFNKRMARFSLKEAHGFERALFAAPWLRPDPQGLLDQMSLDEIAAWEEAVPAGVMARQGSSPFSIHLMYPT